MILRGSMSKFAIGGPLGAKFNDTTHFGPFLKVSIEGWPPLYGATVKNLTLGFSPNFLLGVPLHVGKSGIISGPKVDAKFFTVGPYTPCNRVSRSFLICPIGPIWQIWSLSGQKNMFFGGLVKRGNQVWIVFGWFQGFLGHQNDFWKFQKVSKFLTQNSVKNTGNFVSFSWPTEALFERFRNFP